MVFTSLEACQEILLEVRGVTPTNQANLAVKGSNLATKGPNLDTKGPNLGTSDQT